MYKFIALIFKNINYVFKLIQILGIFYVTFFAIYWICEIMELSFSGMLDFLYVIPIEITENLLNTFNINLSSDFSLIKPEIFFALVLTVITFLIYNLIFFPLGNIEEYFVNKSYEKNEHDF